MTDLDLVVRAGLVVDGSGAPGYRADVGVRTGRVVCIGKIDEGASEEIDAEGHVVAPGFIDGHTHLDAQVDWDPMGTSVCWHGVTTALMGNCGFTLAPSRAGERDLVLRNLERAEDIPRQAMLAGIEWNWESFTQYLDVLDAMPKGLNLGAYVGHSALRTYVMGERAFEEPATADDVDAMCAELAAAVAAGAAGFSTSRSSQHATSDDRPVASRVAEWGEVACLVEVLRKQGRGLFELTNETHPPGAERDGYFERLRTLAVASGRPTTFMVHALPWEPGAWQERLSYLDASARVGGRMTAQVHTREFQMLHSFETTLPFDRLPGWAKMRSLASEDQLRVLSDDAARTRLVAEAESGPYAAGIGAESRPPDYEHMYVVDNASGPNATVAELASARGISPVDVIIDLGIRSGLRQLFAQAFLNFDQDAVLALLRHPRTVVGASDSGAHVSQIMDSSLPTHLLGHWVRRRQAFTLEEAVRMLTWDQARAYGLAERGLVKEGFAADLCVFDPETVAPTMPVLARDLPSGAPRWLQRADGIAATVVNGVVVHRGADATGALPGRLLRRWA